VLTKLKNIRRLLTDPTAANIRAANTELLELIPSVEAFSGRISVQQETTPDLAEFVARVRSELVAVASLSQNASDYFNRLALLSAAKFGAYERTGTFRTLHTSLRMSVQL
jgi:hypothetical protein